MRPSALRLVERNPDFMSFIRPSRLRVLFCLCVPMVLTHLAAQTPVQQTPQSTAPQQPAAQQPKPAAQQPANPFETVPSGTPQPQRAAPAPGQPVQQPQFEAPKPTAPSTQPAGAAAVAAPLESNVVEAIEFRGSRRVPQDTMRAIIFTKTGDVYADDTLRRDFMALWNTNRFDDIRLESETGERGGVILRFVLVERPVVRDIKYEGLKSASTSDVLDRFKERKVGLVVESMYDPNVVNHASVVLKDLLGERGHQYAIVDPQLRRIPPSSLEIVFKVTEGPKVKIGEITILGNEAFSRRAILRAMKNSHPLGIPYSIFFEELFAKTYDGNKLEEDKERVRDAYQKKGYFTAKALDQTVKLRTTGGPHGQIHIPLLKENKIAQYQDITFPVEEGQKYFLNKVNFEGVKLFRSTEFLARLFQMSTGEPFSTEKLRNGIKNMTKVYSQFGYIDYVGEPQIDVIPNSNKIDLTLTADEGKQFFVRRIDFVGNTTTRDKVIRREVLIDEGDVYNSSLWDASILRLNQLGYFQTLKENESYELKRNSGTNTVDILLKVKEQGRNSISLNGGVSGIAGTFIGANYATNNFLGLGATLSLAGQWGTLTNSISIGYTEPYLFDRPLQAGIQVYLRKFNYDQGRQISLLQGVDVTSFYNSLGSANVLNYAQNSKGISVSASYPIKRSFARLGISYGYDDSNIITRSEGAKTYFTYLNFLGVSGPNALNGIKTSKVIPSYSYNSRNNYQNPTAGSSIFASMEFSGSILGGNVNTLRPTFDYQYYHVSPKFRRNVLALHVLASSLSGFGGKVAPPFARTFIGGENDVRGFEFYRITPVAYIPSSVATTILHADGTPAIQKVLVNGQTVQRTVSQNVPTYQIITPGGDTQVVVNFEYRIPIFGPVTLAPFADVGMNRVLFANQLKVNEGQIVDLNLKFPQASFTDKVRIAPGTQKIRSSVGVELQVVLPIVQAPFRIYWAYNPTVVNEFLQAPIVLDPSMFPNSTTFLNTVNRYSPSYPNFEKHSVFRFTIGRTF